MYLFFVSIFTIFISFTVESSFFLREYEKHLTRKNYFFSCDTLKKFSIAYFDNKYILKDEKLLEKKNIRDDENNLLGGIKKEFTKIEFSQCSKTNNLYLLDTYRFTGSSRFINQGKDPKRGDYLIFDETIFYPQGGGQPSDTGKVIINGNNYDVSFVSFMDGVVRHYVTGINDLITPESSVYMEINSENRLKNAKAHTAGHLLGCVIESLAPEITAAKGYHFSDGPYVEFEGKLYSQSFDTLKEMAEEKIISLIQAQTPITFRDISSEDLLGLKISKNFKIPDGKKSRVVQIEGFDPVPCGGTHLQNLSELEFVKIRKIQTPKGNTKISYNFS